MPIVFYRCEKCYRECATIEDAERCEESHLSLASATIRGYCLTGKLPYSIEVTFNNGDTRLYLLEGMQ